MEKVRYRAIVCSTMMWQEFCQENNKGRIAFVDNAFEHNGITFVHINHTNQVLGREWERAYVVFSTDKEDMGVYSTTNLLVRQGVEIYNLPLIDKHESLYFKKRQPIVIGATEAGRLGMSSHHKHEAIFIVGSNGNEFEHQRLISALDVHDKPIGMQMLENEIAKIMSKVNPTSEDILTNSIPQPALDERLKAIEELNEYLEKQSAEINRPIGIQDFFKKNEKHPLGEVGEIGEKVVLQQKYRSEFIDNINAQYPTERMAELTKKVIMHLETSFGKLIRDLEMLSINMNSLLNKVKKSLATPKERIPSILKSNCKKKRSRFSLKSKK